MVLGRQPDWVSKTYPIEHVAADGERRATWPGRYPLEWIDEKKASFARVGLTDDFMQEYMCVAEDAKRKIFTPDMFTVKPTIRTWQPTFAFYDPARTTKATSATTGWAVWSWVGNRMVVWDGGGDLWKPDEMIDHIFRVDEEYGPVAIGVERDGLEEFLMQPLRHEMLAAAGCSRSSPTRRRAASSRSSRACSRSSRRTRSSSPRTSRSSRSSSSATRTAASTAPMRSPMPR
jgi:hypothetical protein